MKVAAALGLSLACLAAHAQVACTMPNGRTITLNLTHTCPAGATGARSLDGQPVQIESAVRPSAEQAPTKRPTPTNPTPQATPSDGSRVVGRPSSAACISKEVYEQLTKIAVQGDSTAFIRALSGSVLTGQCVIFKRGDVVYIDDTALFSGLVRLRPRGEVRAYWTAMETISTN